MSDKYWKELRCQYCKAKGTVYPVRKEQLKTEHGFGMVTRTQVSETVGPNAYGEPTVYQQKNYFQQRVPVIRTTYTMVYQCRNCHAFTGSREFTSETEDFLQGPALSRDISRELVKEKVVQKVNLTCQYCKKEVSTTDKKCPNCAAPIL